MALPSLFTLISSLAFLIVERLFPGRSLRPVKGWYGLVLLKRPTLFIAGDLDGQTPPHNAQAARLGFRHGHQFLVHGAGHDPSLFFSSPALFDAITAFMMGKDTPDRQFDAPKLNFLLSRSETVP